MKRSAERRPPDGKKINRWTGEFPYEANPGIRNPEKGLLGNTNNKSVDRPFPGHISFRWGDTQRVQRLKELVKDRNAHTLDSFRETQLDVMSVTATTLVSLVARDLWHTVEGVPGNDAERLRFEAIDRLGEWDGRMDELSPEPLIYAEWMRELYSSLLKDDLEEIFEDMERPDPVFIERVFRDMDGASAWCDYRQSQATENCSVVAEDSLDNALSKLSSKYGSDIGEWRWGKCPSSGTQASGARRQQFILLVCQHLSADLGRRQHSQPERGVGRRRQPACEQARTRVQRRIRSVRSGLFPIHNFDRAKRAFSVATL